MSNVYDIVNLSNDAVNTIRNPAVKFATAKLIERCYYRGIEIRITHGTRTMTEQQNIYNQGRTAASKAKGEVIVSNALPGHSYHNFDLAIDFVLRKGGYDMKADYNDNNVSDWIEVVTQAKLLGFEWGGDFHSFKDNPHFQMTFGLTTAQLRAGRKPTASQVQDVINKINKLEEVANVSEVSYKELEAKVEVLQEAVVNLQKRANVIGNQVPAAWAQPLAKQLKDLNIVGGTNDKNNDFFVVFAALANTGLLDADVIALLKDKAQIAKLKGLK
ncbi:Peptidoglycan L-alanyl-D-glutamate endopeptidase CwlK precursor [compost metagenome]